MRSSERAASFFVLRVEPLIARIRPLFHRRVRVLADRVCANDSIVGAFSKVTVVGAACSGPRGRGPSGWHICEGLCFRVSHHLRGFQHEPVRPTILPMFHRRVRVLADRVCANVSIAGAFSKVSAV